MFGIGSTELALILLFAFLILGPDKLPKFARTLGRAIAKFRDVQDEVNEVVKREVYDPINESATEAKSTKPAPKANTAPASATESFAERKARYDRAREARMRQDTQEGPGAVPQSAPKPAVSAEELYGVTATAPAASSATGAAAGASASAAGETAQTSSAASAQDEACQGGEC